MEDNKLLWWVLIPVIVVLSLVVAYGVVPDITDANFDDGLISLTGNSPSNNTTNDSVDVEDGQDVSTVNSNDVSSQSSVQTKQSTSQSSSSNSYSQSQSSSSNSYSSGGSSSSSDSSSDTSSSASTSSDSAFE